MQGFPETGFRSWNDPTRTISISKKSKKPSPQRLGFLLRAGELGNLNHFAAALSAF
jgi:hypothetical protein